MKIESFRNAVSLAARSQGYRNLTIPVLNSRRRIDELGFVTFSGFKNIAEHLKLTPVRLAVLVESQETGRSPSDMAMMNTESLGTRRRKEAFSNALKKLKKCDLQINTIERTALQNRIPFSALIQDLSAIDLDKISDSGNLRPEYEALSTAYLKEIVFQRGHVDLERREIVSMAKELVDRRKDA